MIDNDGDEKYQPMLIPLEGGFPEPAFGDKLAEHQVYLSHCFPKRSLVYMSGMALSEGTFRSFRGDLETGEVEKLAQSRWGGLVAAVSANHDKVVIGDVYDRADVVLYLWTEGGTAKTVNANCFTVYLWRSAPRREGAPERYRLLPLHRGDRACWSHGAIR